MKSVKIEVVFYKKEGYLFETFKCIYMSLTIIEVENGNIPEQEFVILKATAKMNIKEHAIVDRTFSPKVKVSNEFRHIFFFPNLVVEKDDLIILCTGIGDYVGRTKIEDGIFVHLLFWQSGECVWNDNGNDRASLIKYTVLQTGEVLAV